MSRGNNTNNNNITNVISRHHSDDVALGLYTDSTVPVYTLTRVCDNLPSPGLSSKIPLSIYRLESTPYVTLQRSITVYTLYSQIRSESELTYSQCHST